MDSPTGIFLVTKTIQTKRYAHCLSRGSPGQISQIRVYGNTPATLGSSQFQLPTAASRIVPVRNDLGFDLEDSGDKGNYTIFIEREAVRFFALTAPTVKDAAAKLWR